MPRQSRQEFKRRRNADPTEKANYKRKPLPKATSKPPTKPQKIFVIKTSGNPNSCLIETHGCKFRALVDTGAEVSLISTRAYRQMKHRPQLAESKVALQGASGDSLHVRGLVALEFEVGGVKTTHSFHVVDNANRNVILGCDWLTKHRVRLYFDLHKMKVGEQYVNLDQDIHVASIVRLAKNQTIKPQTAAVFLGKVKTRPYFQAGQQLEIRPVEKNGIADEPGLMVPHSVTTLDEANTVKMMIVNNTNRTYHLSRGCIVGQLTVVQDGEISSVAEITKQHQPKDTGDLSQADVPEVFREVLLETLHRNEDVFAKNDLDLGRTDTVKMKIDTGDHPPIRLRPYRTPMMNKPIVDKAIDDMLATGVIERSRSPWSFPIVIANKRDGSKRFCVDFRALNKITKPLSWPLPLIDDILARLGHCRFFSSLDLLSGYWQILMDDDSKDKTTFVCHRGVFSFNVMAFGLMNAPSLFSELMSRVLEGCEEFATAYLDDVIIFSDTLENHLHHLDLVFNQLREHGLKLKLRKCSFLKDTTNYLGFEISADGLRPNEDKVAAIRNMNPPTTVREIRGFIGMCSYYRRFIPNFSGIAEPLIALTRKHARFTWKDEHQNAFDFIKRSLTVVPLLVFPDPNRPYILYTDASEKCIGACLAQEDENGEEQPIHFLSHKLSDTQTRWSVIEKEAYAIHFALQKLDYYLHAAHFIIRTDHQPLRMLLETPMQNKKIQLWSLNISAYNCKIEYIAGKNNAIADLLSRTPDSGGNREHYSIDEGQDIVDINDNTFRINALNSNNFEPKDYAAADTPQEGSDDDQAGEEIFKPLNMRTEQQKDPVIQKIVEKMKKKDGSVGKNMLLEDDILYFVSHPDENPVVRLYVPVHLRLQVIVAYHDNNGHFGVEKTNETLMKKYFWPGMFRQVWEHVAKCIPCNQRNLRRQRPPLQETEIPPFPFAKISLDLSGPYPTTLSGNKYIVSFVDWYSGWPEAFPTPDKNASTIASLVLEEIFPRFGSCLVMVTDNGTENDNRIMREVLSELKIHHVTTSRYHPQSNAKVERFHRTMHDVLAKKLEDPHCTTWDLHLNQTLAAVRFNTSNSTAESPYFLLYGRDVILPVDNVLQPRRKYHGDETHRLCLQAQHEAFVSVHRHMKRAKRRQAKYADRNAKTTGFKVGDPVYIKKHVRDNKLQPKWEPYYRVIEKKSPLTYKLKNQLTGKVVTSHAEHLRLAKIEWEEPTVTAPGRPTTYVVPPAEATEEDDADNDEIVGGGYYGDTLSDEDADGEESAAEERDEPSNRPRSQDQETRRDESESDISSLEDSIPLKELIRLRKRQREDSEDEDDIPLAELRKRIRTRDERLLQEQKVTKRTRNDLSDEDEDDASCIESRKRLREEPDEDPESIADDEYFSLDSSKEEGADANDDITFEELD